MKKLVLVALLVVTVLVLVSAYYFGKQDKNMDKDTMAAISLLQKEGYSDIKIIDSDYITAIPGNYDGITPLIGALSSLVVSAQKDGASIKLKVKKVGLPDMVIEKM